MKIKLKSSNICLKICLKKKSLKNFKFLLYDTLKN